MNSLKAPYTYAVCTAEQSRKMDADTIHSFGIDGFTLMEVAGISTALRLLEEIERGSHGVFLCGKGNNAGDALVVARYLVQHGMAATLVFVSGTEDLSKDTVKNLGLIRKIKENDPEAGSIDVIESWNNFSASNDFDFIVDGMLGTGLKSDLRGDYTDAVEWANKSKLPVYAIDIPTGLHADTGKVIGSAVKALKTFTYGVRKLGFYLNDGSKNAGEIIYCELPFPNYLKKCDTYLLDESWVNELHRAPAKHKYEAGVLYVLAGSEGLTGAAMMTAESAWAEGIGAVIIVCPHGLLSIFEHNLPQIIKKPIGKKSDTHFKKEHLDKILSIITEKPGTAIIGPGIGRNADTKKLTVGFLNSFTGKLLIDADGLWCLAQEQEWNKPEDAEWLLTPHPGELSNLLQEEIDDENDRLEKVRHFCPNKKITMVSKGYPSIIGTSEGKCYLTGYDTRVFSRAGFGDILAGKIGAYWALGNSADYSSALGLLNGFKKARKIIEQQTGPVEPKDLI